MRSPIDAHFDTARRAALSDQADTATRRMARDIRKALPNSIRNPSANCIEVVPIRTSGRYQADVDTTAGPGAQTNSVLDFSVADTRFNMLGNNADLPADNGRAHCCAHRWRSTGCRPGLGTGQYHAAIRSLAAFSTPMARS
jgi:MSHA biogenesis protein MshO